MNRDINPTTVYTTEEAARLLVVSKSTIQRWAKSRRLITVPGFAKHRFLGETLIQFARGNAEDLIRHNRRAA